ncbi:hypothetical protein B9D94_22935 [Paenibacillus sp. Cedars]|nr:hypothetical protein B9D94_22935 [Paenibacillus sp. Cedars]
MGVIYVVLSIRRSRILKIVLIILLIAAFFAAPESTSADTSLKNVETGRLPYSVAVNPVTNKIYVVNKLSHNMTIIDGATNKSKTIEVGKNPEKVSVNPVTNKIYVTLGEQKVAVIDGESDTVTTKVAVGSSPTSVEVNTVTNKIYVVNVNSNTVTIIDGVSNETTEVKVGNKPVAVAVNSVTNKAYVANQVDDTVTVIEGSTYKKTLVTDVRPSRVAVNPVTNKIYVNNIYSSTVSVIDGASDTIMSSEKVGSAPWGVAVNPVTNKIYVANTSSNNVTIIDGATDKAMTTVGAGYRPEAVAVNPVTNKIYVANEDDKVTVIDGESDTAMTTIAAGDFPVAVAVNPVTNKIYVANQMSDTVTVIDGASYTPTTVEGEDGPISVAVNPVTNKIYVANIRSHSVTVIDGASNETTTLAVGVNPTAVAVNTVTNKIYVTNSDSNTITVIDGVSNETTTIATGIYPAKVVVNPVTNKIYVANSGSNSVTVIDGASNETTTVDAGAGPSAIDVNPVTNKIYVSNTESHNVTVIDGTNNETTTVATGYGPGAIAVNPVTNKIYVTSDMIYYVTVIDGASNETTTVATGNVTNAVAVNPVTNKIYVTNNFTGNVTVIDGENNGTTTVAVGYGPRAVAVNPVTNKIYVANIVNDTMSIIDGESNTSTAVLAGKGPVGVAVNPVTNKVYVANIDSNNVSTFDFAGRTTNPLTVAITPLPGNIAYGPDTTFTFEVSNTYSPYSPEVQGVYFQLDHTEGAWVKASPSGGNWTGTLTSLPYGQHVLYVLALEAQGNGVSAGIADAYAFNVLPENMISPAIASFDKYAEAASYTDVTTTWTLYGNTLSSITFGTETLVPGTDYTVSGGNTVTIKKEYLAAQSVGTVNLTFTFSRGAAQTLSITVSDSTPPGTPTGLTATAGNEQVELSWSGVPGTVTYSVYGGTASGVYDSTPIATVNGSTTSYTVTGLTNGMAYYFVVTASNESGYSGYSNEASATPQMPSPGAPTGLTANAGNEQVELSWSGMPGTVTYSVYGGTASGVYDSTPIATVNGSTTSYTATGLTNGTAYYFAVTASNESGYSGYSNEASATPQMPSPGAPTAPTGLTANAGNEQVELSWSGVPGTVTYSVYGGTASGVYDSTPIATVNGSTTSYTATGLTNGTTYYFAVMASNESGYSGYSNEASATPRTGSTPPNSSGGTPSTTNPPFNHNSINVPKTQNNIHVTISGQMQEGITTDAITTDNGLTVQSVTIDAAKLSEALAKEVDKPVIVIAVNSSADKVTVALTGEAVESLKNKQAIIEVHTPNGNYKLPATELGMDRFSAQLGDPVVLKDVLVHVDIAKSGIDKIRLLENTSKKGRFTVMFPPVDFTITASYKGKTVNLDKFTSYVEREIPLPEGVDPNKVTTAIVLEANGRVRHVPTNLTLRDGKYYSVASSMMNSTYSLIWHPMRFADVEGHWSQAAVNDMASRMVVNGVDATHYLPNAAITRAEFAAIIVRALGLTNNGVKSTFEDVKSGDWYAGAVATAQEYGITAGDEDGTFHPAETITREEAMVMIARAMKLAGLDTSLSVAEADAALSKFADRASVAIWAQQAVAATVKMGLVSGSDTGLQPKSDITRAETAVIVQRMLEKAGLIDNKHSE